MEKINEYLDVETNAPQEYKEGMEVSLKDMSEYKDDERRYMDDMVGTIVQFHNGLYTVEFKVPYINNDGDETYAIQVSGDHLKLVSMMEGKILAEDALINEDYKKDTSKYISSVLKNIDDTDAKKFLEGLKKFVEDNGYLTPDQRTALANFGRKK